MKSKSFISTAVMTAIAFAPMATFAQTSDTTITTTIAYNGECAKTEYLRHENIIPIQFQKKQARFCNKPQTIKKTKLLMQPNKIWHLLKATTFFILILIKIKFR